MFLKQRIKEKQKYFLPIIIVLICTYAMYLRIAYRAAAKIWIDELSQLSRMTGSFIDLLKQVAHLEECSYLSGDYYLIYPFFKIFGHNK